MTAVWIGAYVVGFFVNIMAAGVIWDEYDNKEMGARIGLLSPVWPLSLVFGLSVLAVFLWKHAGLETRKDRA